MIVWFLSTSVLQLQEKRLSESTFNCVYAPKAGKQHRVAHSFPVSLGPEMPGEIGHHHYTHKFYRNGQKQSSIKSLPLTGGGRGVLIAFVLCIF